MTSTYPAKKNAAFKAVFPILDADGDLVSAAAGLDSEVSIDGGTFADCTNEATEIATSSGMYYLDLTAAEMNGDVIAVIVKCTTTGAKTTALVFYTSAQTLDELDAVADAVKVKTDLIGASVAPAGEYDSPMARITDARMEELDSTNLPADVDAIKNDLDNPAQYKADVSSLALEATLTAMKGAGWSTETLKVIKEYVDDLHDSAYGLSALKTLIDDLNNLADSEVWAYATRTLTDPNSYKADVSNLDVAVSTRATPVQVNAEVDQALADIYLDYLIKVDFGASNPTIGSLLDKIMNKSGSQTFDPTTDSLEAIRDRGDAAWITATGFSTHAAADVWAVGTRALTDKAGFSLSASGIDAIWDEVVEGSLTGRQILRLNLSALAGKSGGGGTATITFRDNADGKNRISATVDENGNRTAVVLDVS